MAFSLLNNLNLLTLQITSFITLIKKDFAFLPFGGGQRKCVGDQFAMMEATVTAAMLLNKYEFKFDTCPSDVGMKTGATIHTMNGLNMIVNKVPTEIPSSNGWWAHQHLKRGLAANGKPLSSVDDGTAERTGGCPVKH